MRIETEFFEYVDTQNRRHRFDTIDEAKAMRADVGKGQVRRRVDYEDVLALYEVRNADGDVIGSEQRAALANEIARDHPGSKVFMVPDMAAAS